MCMTSTTAPTRQPRAGVFPATPAKLRDGTWGARVTGRVNPGITIEVRAASGKVWEAVIDEIIWTGADRATGEPVALVRTVRDSRPAAAASREIRQTAAATRAGGSRPCRSCGGPVQSYSDGRGAGLCHDCC